MLALLAAKHTHHVWADIAATKIAFAQTKNKQISNLERQFATIKSIVIRLPIDEWGVPQIKCA